MRDYNEIVDNSKKWGAALRRENQMEDFRNTLEACQLFDLGFIGPKYTWMNGRDNEEFTKERLERALGNLEWCNTFSEAEVQILEARSSDHKPMLVNMGGFKKQNHVKNMGFCYEASWALEDDFQGVVKEAWAGGNNGQHIEMDRVSGMSTLCNKLHGCAGVLRSWGKEKLGNANHSIRNITAQLQVLKIEECP